MYSLLLTGMSKEQFSCQDGVSWQFELLRWLLWLCSCSQCSWLLFSSVLINSDDSRGGKWWTSHKSFFNLPVLILGKHHCPLCHRPSEPGEHLFHERNPAVTQVPSAASPSRGLLCWSTEQGNLASSHWTEVYLELQE